MGICADESVAGTGTEWAMPAVSGRFEPSGVPTITRADRYIRMGAYVPLRLRKPQGRELSTPRTITQCR